MGVMYKDKRVWTTKEINSVTRVNYASDFVYKKKELLEEGKDYFKLDKETYRALTNQTGVASGTILTESGPLTLIIPIPDSDNAVAIATRIIFIK